MTKYNQLRVAHIRHLKSDYVLLTLEYDSKMQIPQPGQFFMIKPRNTLIARPISVHNYFTILKKGYLEFLFKVVGKGTSELSRLKRGEITELWGPIGNYFPIEKDRKTAILVAGGRGIAPLFYLATRLFEKGYRIHFFYGVKESDELVHLLRIKNLSEKLYITTEDGKKGKKGLITSLFLEAIKTYTSNLTPTSLFDEERKLSPICYVCGPEIMIEKICEVSINQNIKTYISLEALMGCGSGVCLGCTVETAGGKLFHICKDGPIFDAREFYCR
ncbi:MAG: dihydroorotate dehydrogenase electron transfer subunit [Myxococcota bacterium]